MRILKWFHEIADIELAIVQMSSVFCASEAKMKAAQKICRQFPKKYHPDFYSVVGRECGMCGESFATGVGRAVSYVLEEIGKDSPT